MWMGWLSAGKIEMIVGTTFFKMDGNPYYSPEFGRGGLSATFGVDTTQVVGAPTVTITVEHRNPDEVSFASLGAFDDITAVGAKQKDLTGCKEILRLRYMFAGGDDPTDGIHLLMQAPSWRPY